MKIMVEMTEEEVAKLYLSKNGMVAIDRRLAEEMAAINGKCSVANTWMVYNPINDEYRPSSLFTNLFYPHPDRDSFIAEQKTLRDRDGGGV